MRHAEDDAIIAERLEPSTDAPAPLELSDSTRDRVRALGQWAVRAPSTHNTQPWLFRLRGEAVELCLDRSRTLECVDPDRRAMVMSCGAALYYARLALRNYGYRPEVELLPDVGDPILLARLRIGAASPPTREERQLFAAIPRRRTNRHPFEEREVPILLLRALERAAASEGAWLDIVTDPDDKRAIAELIATGDRLQGSNRDFRRELAQWMHSNRDARRDGIPGYALGFGPLSSRFAPFVVRTFDWGELRAESDFELALHSAGLLVIRTEVDTPAAWLRAGAGVARLLLRAAADGITASFLNQPIEVPSLRRELAQVLCVSGTPQLLLRIGYGESVRETPRRTVDEVLVPY